MFEPPVSTPISRMMRIAASRMRWYSLSVSVCAGATVIESPVCTPIGSKFSIEQTMTTLSSPSRITSSSNSFQPATDSSISTSCVGDASRPQRDVLARTRSRSSAMPPPVPPSVNDGRMMSGSADLVGGSPRASASAARVAAARQVEPDPLHRRLEELAVLGLLDRRRAWRRSARRRSFSRTPRLGELDREVERRSARRASAAARRAARAR